MLEPFEMFRGDTPQIKVEILRSPEDESDWSNSAIEFVFSSRTVTGDLLGTLARNSGVSVPVDTPERIVAIATLPRELTEPLPDGKTKVWYDVQVTSQSGLRQTQQSFFTVKTDIAP